MNNEYDYSGLYQHNNGNEPPQNSYPNVGSSGANTANTARTDYSQTGDGGYTSSYQSGQNGYNGYSYSSAPQQPPQPPRRNHGGWGKRILAGVLCVALGFGGGLGGAVVAGKMGLTGGQVVVQQVVRDESTVASNAGSTGWLVCSEDGETVYLEIRVLDAEPSQGKETDYTRIANIGDQQLQARLVEPYFGLSMEKLTAGTVMIG